MNIDDLEEKARKATPGEWTIDDGHPRDYIGVAFANENERGHVATIVEFKDPQALRDASFIAAASPSVVLALIARLRKAEAVCDAAAELRSGAQQCHNAYRDEQQWTANEIETRLVPALDAHRATKETP